MLAQNYYGIFDYFSYPSCMPHPIARILIPLMIQKRPMSKKIVTIRPNVDEDGNGLDSSIRISSLFSIVKPTTKKWNGKKRMKNETFLNQTPNF